MTTNRQNSRVEKPFSSPLALVKTRDDRDSTIRLRQRFLSESSDRSAAVSNIFLHSGHTEPVMAQ